MPIKLRYAQFFAVKSIPCPPVASEFGNDQVADPRQTAIGQWAGSSLTPGAWFNLRPRVMMAALVSIARPCKAPAPTAMIFFKAPAVSICIGIEAEVIAKRVLEHSVQLLNLWSCCNEVMSHVMVSLCVTQSRNDHFSLRREAEFLLQVFEKSDRVCSSPLEACIFVTRWSSVSATCFATKRSPW